MDFRQSQHELNKLVNPFERFQARYVKKHLADDAARLFQQQQPYAADVIEKIVNYGKKPLDYNVPRRFQTLRNYLTEATAPGQPLTRTVKDDIELSSNDQDIALLDERQEHDKCPKKYGQQCLECVPFSEKVTIPQLHERLKKAVSPLLRCWVISNLIQFCIEASHQGREEDNVSTLIPGIE